MPVQIIPLAVQGTLFFEIIMALIKCFYASYISF